MGLAQGGSLISVPLGCQLGQLEGWDQIMQRLPPSQVRQMKTAVTEIPAGTAG